MTTSYTDLAGKNVLLTGVSGGIGSLTARHLLDAGANVIGHYGRDRAGAEEAMAGVPEDRWTLVQTDLLQAGSSRALWQEAVAWKGRVHVAIINAAMLAENPIDGSDEQWDRAWEETLRVNLLEPANLMREAVSHYREHDGGIVIALSSWAGQRGSAIPQLSAYAASKAALQNLTATIARNHAKEGILGFSVAPGIVHTRMSEISASHRGGVEAVNAILSMGEMVPPEEVASLLVFLASGTCRHLTGGTIDMNGATHIR